MKPFLLISTRDNDRAASAEHGIGGPARRPCPHETWCTCGWKSPPRPALDLDLDAFAGIFLAAVRSMFRTPTSRPAAARRGRPQPLLGVIVASDQPFLGLCHDIGTTTAHLGGLVDRNYG